MRIWPRESRDGTSRGARSPTYSKSIRMGGSPVRVLHLSARRRTHHVAHELHCKGHSVDDQYERGSRIRQRRDWISTRSLCLLTSAVLLVVVVCAFWKRDLGSAGELGEKHVLSTDPVVVASRIPRPAFRVLEEDPGKVIPAIFDAVYSPDGGYADLVFFDMLHCASGTSWYEQSYTVPWFEYQIRLSRNNPGFSGSTSWGPCIGHPTHSTNHTTRSLRCYFDDEDNILEQAVGPRWQDLNRTLDFTFLVDLRSSVSTISSLVDLQVRVPPQLPKVFLSTCSIITADSYRDEMGQLVQLPDFDIGLREWVEYYRIQGVERMIIFDNTVGTTETELEEGDIVRNGSRVTSLPAFNILSPYIDSGFVVYHHWPLPNCKARASGASGDKKTGPGRRSSQYIQESVCMRRYSSTTRWLGIMDADEFFMAADPHTSLVDLVGQLEERRPDAEVFRFMAMQLARCPEEVHGEWTPLMRHVTRFPRVPPYFRAGIHKTKEIIRPDRVWNRMVHQSRESFPSTKWSLSTMGGYGNGLRKWLAPLAIKGFHYPKPTVLWVDNNATGFFLHLKRKFKVTTRAKGDVFSGTCPRPWPPLMHWIGKLWDEAPNLYIDDALRTRWSQLLERQRFCTSGNALKNGTAVTYAEYHGEKGFEVFGSSIRWISDCPHRRIDQNNSWISIRSKRAKHNSPPTVPLQIRCDDLDIL